MNQTALPPDATMMQMLTGYWACQTLATAARLGVMDALPGTAEELARRLNLHPDGLERLLRGCAAVQAIECREGGRYELTELGQFLTSSHPRSMAPMAIMVTDPGHWNSWGRLAHCVRTGQTGVGTEEIFEYYKHHPEESSNFNHAMAGMTAAWAVQLAESYDFSSFGTIADIGGNHGIMLAAALRSNPGARGILFDQAHVLAEADDPLRRHGILERTEKVPGDFFQSVPEADCYLLKHILHDWNDQDSVRILKTIRQAMPEHGRVLVLEMLLDREPGMADLMNLNMLVMTGGRERTAEQFARLFEQAGLRLTRVVPTQAMYCVLEVERNEKLP